MKQTFAIGIGAAAGQGVATPGDIFAKIFSRRGLHLNAYNAYQSIIRGGHTFLTIRTGPEKVTNMGDRLDLLIPLNQDAMDRHLRLLAAGAACIYNSDTIKPGAAAQGAELCALSVSKLADITRNKVAQNTLAVGAGLNMMGIGFQALSIRPFRRTLSCGGHGRIRDEIDSRVLRSQLSGDGVGNCASCACIRVPVPRQTPGRIDLDEQVR
jgi:2-oxoglutarate ferredoxin oxidoreductase subunit alpha